MELPHLGKQCKFEECQQLDFLPSECAYCHANYCGHHLHPSKHLCPDVCENRVEEKSSSVSYRCTESVCSATSPVQMSCVKCHQHFCLQHRYHSCFDQTASQARREKEKAPKEQFRKAKETSDKIVEEKLKNTKNRVTANKIKLMRIKGFAHGDNGIPVADRLFFCVCPPLGCGKCESRPLFVSRTWSVGKCVDWMAKRLKLINRNSEEGSDKLRLFTCDGVMLGPGQDVLIQSFLNDQTLIDGDNLILDYIQQNLLDQGQSQLPNFEEVKSKYVWSK